MRISSLFAVLMILASCGSNPSSPSTAASNSPPGFLADIESLIVQRRYDDAVSYLATVDLESLVALDDEGYLAVAEDMILLPGLDPAVQYDPERDWLFPGTSDVIESAAWQEAATDFAARYNALRRGG